MRAGIAIGTPIGIGVGVTVGIGETYGVVVMTGVLYADDVYTGVVTTRLGMAVRVLRTRPNSPRRTVGDDGRVTTDDELYVGDDMTTGADVVV